VGSPRPGCLRRSCRRAIPGACCCSEAGSVSSRRSRHAALRARYELAPTPRSPPPRNTLFYLGGSTFRSSAFKRAAELRPSATMHANAAPCSLLCCGRHDLRHSRRTSARSRSNRQPPSLVRRAVNAAQPSGASSKGWRAFRRSIAYSTQGTHAGLASGMGRRPISPSTVCSPTANKASATNHVRLVLTPDLARLRPTIWSSSATLASTPCSVAPSDATVEPHSAGRSPPE